ncbi:glycosyltransferase family 2 protein [Glycomyces arizonensis]|uniref:glycosyltransferase family 2 protein n=1 Tax=Glycomyces arizonensis TaxID=256035 RepID=UPI000424193E|nr:glycosyltransferase family 2 protein [Glycomyces arizonensis]
MALTPILEEAGRKTEPSGFNVVVETFRESGPQASFRTALRTRSPLAVRALTSLAAPGLGLDDLIELARGSGDAVERHLDADYVCALAGVLYANGLYDDSLALYSLADRYGGAPVPDEHQNWYARSALHATGSVGDLLPRLTAVGEIDRLGIEADAIHPSLGGDTDAWLAAFGRLTGMRGLTLSDDTSLPYFDRLGANPGAPVKSDTKVSIVMTCFRPGPELRTAVLSVLAQTWQNWELLLVDDCSGEEFHPALAEIRALDPRIKLLMLPRNSGTYNARNRALIECTGQIVTGLDSDDWAHPRWLETQIQPLLDDHRIVMSVSSAVRVHTDLTVTRSNRSIRGPRSTSIMFRAAPVRERMGYFDSVRKGADTEFRMRFTAVFGNRAIKRLTDVPLTLVRLGDETLTSSEFGMNWMHPARMAYQSAQRLWHGEIQSKRADPFLCAAAPERPFYAPEFSRGQRLSGNAYDCVFVADGRFVDEPQRDLLSRMARAAEEGQSIAFLHLESLHRPVPDGMPLHHEVLDALSAHGITFLSPTDEVETDRLVVADPSLWEGRKAEYGLRRIGQTDIGSAVVEPTPWTETAEEPSARTSRARSSRSAVKRWRSGLWRHRRVAAAGLVLAYFVAIVTWPVFGMPVAAVATFAAAAATLFALGVLATAPGYARLMTAIERKTSR